jgi:sorting nexin-5/6/32
VRGKNTKEKLGGLVKLVTKSADELKLSSHKDIDEFFENQRQFLGLYNTRISDATSKSDKMTHKQKVVADCYIKISSGLTNLGTVETDSLRKYEKTNFFHAIKKGLTWEEN